MLRRELKSAVEVILAKMDGQRAVFEARLDGMDTAILLVRDVADKLPMRMDEKVNQLSNLTDVRFERIDTQFAERDVRTEQANLSSKTAVDAALQAQKEAAGNQAETFGAATLKSEQQFTKQIDQQGELIRSEVKSLTIQLDDLKSARRTAEGAQTGQAVAQTTQQTSNTFFVQVMVAAIAAASVAIAIIELTRAHP